MLMSWGGPVYCGVGLCLKHQCQPCFTSAASSVLRSVAGDCGRIAGSLGGVLRTSLGVLWAPGAPQNARGSTEFQECAQKAVSSFIPVSLVERGHGGAGEGTELRRARRVAWLSLFCSLYWCVLVVVLSLLVCCRCCSLFIGRDGAAARTAQRCP